MPKKPLLSDDACCNNVKIFVRTPAMLESFLDQYTQLVAPLRINQYLGVSLPRNISIKIFFLERTRRDGSPDQSTLRGVAFLAEE